jgi:two-component system cell cycle sensor histidine kinase/response regulator CckA
LSDPEKTRAELRAALEREQQAREALRVAEGRLAEVQSLAKIGSWELDLSTNALWWSDEIYRMFEIDPKQFSASYEAFVRTVHPEDRDAVNLAYAESVAAKAVYDVVHRLLMPDGRIKYVRELARTVYDDRGLPVRSAGTVQDITERRLAQEQAFAQERRFRSLIEHSSDLIIVFRPDGSVSFLNAAFETMLGLRAEDWLGKSVFGLIWPDDVARTEALVARSLAARGEAIPWQLRVRHADGTWRWLEGTGTNRVADPTIGGTVLNCRDITERKRAEEALRESEERLRQAVRVSHIGIFDHDHLTDTIYWSPRQREIYGWDADAPVTLADFIGLVHPEDAQRIGEAVRRAHDPSGDGVWDVEHRIIRRDGSVRWLIERSQTFFGGEGAPRPVRTVGAVIDITEAKLAEQALRLKDLAIATSLNGVAIADPEGRLVYVNPAFLHLWGYAAEAEVLGRRPEELVEPGAALEILEQLRARGAYQGEVLARRRDGTTFEVLISANAVRGADGKLVNLMGSFLDVSEAKRLQAQLLHSQKMESVGRLAGGVAHDFNNLLTVIKGYLELALSGLHPRDPLYHDLSEANTAADSAAALTQQLLAFSRKQIINPQVLSLNDVITRVRKMLPRLLGEDIELRTFLAPALGRVRFDPGQSEQILINLAVNARDAMPEGGRLTIETANTSFDYVMLAVSDTGSGMSDDVKAHLFEPFFTTKGPGRGTGLGLAMIFGAVSQNGGRIEVDSEPGHGTTFKIYLPRVHEAAVEAWPEPRAAQWRGTETILLVEDDEAVRSLAVRVLVQHGYAVHAFRDGTSAMDAVAGMTEPLHLLITDVVMPEMNGPAMAQRIKELRPAIRVLFTSGYTDNVIVHHGVLAEGVEFLPKPYSPESLARRVREVLDEPGR